VLLFGTVNPAGSVSANPTPVSPAVELGLVIVNVSVEVPFTGMLVGLNALATVGGWTTVNVALWFSVLLHDDVASTVYVSASERIVLLMLSVLVAVPLPLVMLIVALPPRLTPLVSVTPFFFHTKVTGALAETVVVNVAVVPRATL